MPQELWRAMTTDGPRPRVDEGALAQRRCIATTVLGEQCRNAAMPGSAYCRVRTHAGGAKATARYRAKLGELYAPDAEPVTDPVAHLQALAGMYRHALDMVGRRVNGLEDWRTVTVEGSEQARAEVQLWERLAESFRKALVDLVRLGLDERKVELEERYGALVQDMLRHVFDDLGLTTAQHAKLGEVMPRRLRELGMAIDTWDAGGEVVDVTSLAPSEAFGPRDRT